ncbi:MAG: hypothetical protein ABJD11_03670 [Gemmatimonadota bacterium]
MRLRQTFSASSNLLLSALCMVITLDSCGRPAAPLDHVAAADVRQGAMKMARAIPEALAQKGPEAWLDFFTGDSSFYMASDGPLEFPSLDSARTAVRGLAMHVRRIELRWGAVRVDSLSPSLATIAASFDETLFDTAGLPASFAGYFTGVAEQVDTGWKLRSAHWSLTTPSPQSSRDSTRGGKPVQ